MAISHTLVDWAPKFVFEKKQLPFTVTRPNTVQAGVITFQPNEFDWIVRPENLYSSYKEDRNYLIDKDS